MGITLLYARFISRLRNTDLRPILLLIILVATWLLLNIVMPKDLRAQTSGFSQLDEIPAHTQQVTTGVYPLTVFRNELAVSAP